MDSSARITFVGDIMCEKPLQQAFDRYGAAAFSSVFARTKDLFARADYVVGNLETVFGGGAYPYTRELYRFNTPDGFAEALSGSGIDLVTTATNHCLDCGIEGLERTVDVLDRYGISHTGTWKAPSDQRVFVAEVADRRVAFLNYTYGTNVHETGVWLNEADRYRVGLLRPQTARLQTYAGGRAGALRRAVSSALAKVTDEETRIRLKRALGMAHNAVRVDDLTDADLSPEYLETILREMKEAKAKAGTVIVCLHCGGQFNPVPGGLTRYFARWFAEHGADAVVCHHAHVVQRAERIRGVPVAYCIGNYSISPSSVYLLPENRPDCSVALHLTLDGNGKITPSFSVLKTVEDARRVPVVWPADRLYETLDGKGRDALTEDVRAVAARLTGRDCREWNVAEEYALE